MITNNTNTNTGILIRFDDIAPNMNWKMMDKCEALLNQFSIKPVLGVIPDNKEQLIDETLIRTSVLSGIALGIAVLFPHILKESFYTKIVYVFLFLVIARFIDIIFFKSSHKITFSYIFILIFFIFIMYDSKFIMQRAATCKNNADYVDGTLEIFLDLINLFQKLLIVGDN